MDAPERPLFLAAKPGLEPALADEAREAGFAGLREVAGGVEAFGGWEDVMRANLSLRGAERVLWRIAEFRAMHPAQLDKRARKVAWAEWLPSAAEVSVEATCRKSRIYHQGAARSRIAGALEAAGCRVVERGGLRVLARIEDDLCTISLDTSGAPLHRRGYKQAVGKAPMRETMAALFLRQMGHAGREPVVDPMCGSGTFPIEAALIAASIPPGHARAFAFVEFRSFDADRWQSMKREAAAETAPEGPLACGSDRDRGAVKLSVENAARAGVAALCSFTCQPLGAAAPPDCEPGFLVVNPPYGGRIGNRKPLFGLYASLGRIVQERFQGWKVGLVTSDDGLASATGLDLTAGPPVAHGGLRVRLWRTSGVNRG